MKAMLKQLAWAGLVLVTIAGCARGGPKLGQMDADQLLARGMERLESHKWQDAIQALEAFVFQYPTHARYQEARYRLAEAYYGKGEYISAATEFGRLANDFPTGTWADDSRYQVCDSYAHLSPKPQLDQEYTQEAIDHCQSLLAYFPDSEFAERGREILTQLTNKLAQKIFLNGEHYFKRNAFDSAEIYFNSVLADYPSTSAAPKALLRLLQGYEKLGYEEEAKEARERLLREYPASPEAKELNGGSVAGK
jgi:outer membrane protein assembly factor BamD